MNELVNQLEQLSLKDNASDGDINSLCEGIEKIVLEDDVKISDIIYQFKSIEISTGKKINNKLWNAIFSLMNKQRCNVYQSHDFPKYVESY